MEEVGIRSGERGMRFEVWENTADARNGNNLMCFMWCKWGFEIKGSIRAIVTGVRSLNVCKECMKFKTIFVGKRGRNKGIRETKVRKWLLGSGKRSLVGFADGLEDLGGNGMKEDGSVGKNGVSGV